MMNRLKLKVFVFLFFLQASTYLNAAVVVSSSAPDFASAQRIANSDFSLIFDGNVLDSGTIPRVQIIQTGRATSGFDFYRFSHGGGLVHLDVDSKPISTNFDTMFGIWDGVGNILASNDDTAFGDPGDIPGVLVGGRYNSNLSNLDLPNGEYVVGVGRFFSRFVDGGSILGPQIPIGGTYTLNISSQVPEPTSMATLSLASVFLLGRLKRVKKIWAR
jgi:hypothetical protein